MLTLPNLEVREPLLDILEMLPFLRGVYKVSARAYPNALLALMMDIYGLLSSPFFEDLALLKETFRCFQPMFFFGDLEGVLRGEG